ncbi:MAG: DsrE family protein [Peptococcaceae bacterium]
MDMKIPPEKLLIVWTSGERDVALKMVFMYAFNGKFKEWWQDISVLIWGPSAQLAAKDEEIQDRLLNLKDAGVKLTACKACTDSYGISEEIEKLGIEVIYVGEGFTKSLKEGWVTITF